MKRYKALLSGIALTFMFLVVPSYAASSPSGSAYGYITSYTPSASPTQSTSNYYTAVTQSLLNGFKMLSKGVYTIQTDSAAISKTLTTLKSKLYTGEKFTYMSTKNNNQIGYTAGDGVLNAINYNVFYGLKWLNEELYRTNIKLDSLDGHITTMDKNISSGFTNLNKKLDTKFQDVIKVLAGGNTASQYFVVDQSVTGGFPMIHAWFSKFYDVLFDPLDEELKDATEDQKQDVLDNFFGDGSNGVQSGQIGSLGDISSSAGGLLDSGGNIGNVFEEIGNSGSSVWSWFTSDNAMAINGPGYTPPDPIYPPDPTARPTATPKPEPTPTSVPTSEPTTAPTADPDPDPDPEPSEPDPVPVPTPTPDPTTPDPTPEPEPTPTPAPTPEPIPSNPSYPFTAYAAVSPCYIYTSATTSSPTLEAPYGFQVTVLGASGNRFKVDVPGLSSAYINKSDLALSVPQSARARAKAQGLQPVNPGLEVVDFYSLQREALRRLIGW